jgi:hypothetical protein
MGQHDWIGGDAGALERGGEAGELGGRDAIVCDDDEPAPPGIGGEDLARSSRPCSISTA